MPGGWSYPGSAIHDDMAVGSGREGEVGVRVRVRVSQYGKVNRH